MFNYLILSASILVGVINSILLNVTGKKSGLKSVAAKVLYNGILFTVITFGLLIYNGGITSAANATVFWGVVYGFCAALTYITALFAYASGPMNFTVLITYCLGLLIPTLAGPLIWPGSNPVDGWQWAGVVLLIISLILGLKSSDGKKMNVKWLIFAFVAATSCGGLGIIQQAHQKTDGKPEINMMLMIAFAVASVIAFVFAVVLSKLYKEKPVSEFKKADVCASVGCGLCVGFVNVANLYLSGELPAVVFFPVCNGGLVIISTLVSLVAFKEKLSLRQSVGIVLGIVSLILVCGVL